MNITVHHKTYYVHLFTERYTRDSAGWSGTAPHLEVNYGVVTNFQLHLIAPFSFVAPHQRSASYGYGDMELGAKYRFVQEREILPQAGIFPLVELPTGDQDRGLGGGETQLFLPVWLQKSAGPWTTYGGGGYWINPGAGNRNWWFSGWLLQRQVTSFLTLGAELFHATPSEADGDSEAGFNTGGFLDLSKSHHLLFSVGHSIQGPSRLLCYVAYQLTFGPGD